MACKADVVRETRTDVTRHTRPCGRAAQAHATSRWRVAGADAWQGHAGPHGRPGGPPRGVGGLAFEGPMG